MKRFALATVLVFALSGCGVEGMSRLARSSPSPAATASDYKDEPVDWFLKSISGDGQTIAIVYTMSGVASGCQREGVAVVEESSDKVTITAIKEVTTDRNRPCTEELAYVDETATLGQPLGERALVGCRAGKREPSENGVCRDRERSRTYGVPVDDPPATGDPSVSAAPVPPTATPPPAAAPAGYARRDVEWFIRSIENDNRTLKMDYQTGGCDRDGGASVSESPNKVIVTVWKYVNTQKDVVCTADVRISNATVNLKESLGERALVGCRPGKTDVSENSTCRDASRKPF
jgi:hypothetical protein